MKLLKFFAQRPAVKAVSLLMMLCALFSTTAAYATTYASEASSALTLQSYPAVHVDMPLPGRSFAWEMSSGDLAFAAAHITFSVVDITGEFSLAQDFISVNIVDGKGNELASTLSLAQLKEFSHDFGTSRTAQVLHASLHVDEAASDLIRAEWFQLYWQFNVQDLPDLPDDGSSNADANTSDNTGENSLEQRESSSYADDADLAGMLSTLLARTGISLGVAVTVLVAMSLAICMLIAFLLRTAHSAARKSPPETVKQFFDERGGGDICESYEQAAED